MVQRVVRLPGVARRLATVKAFAGLAILTLASVGITGCSADPSASLFTPPPPAPVDRSAIRATDEDGFPNVLVTPAPVPGEWRPPERVAAAEAGLAARGAATDRAAARAAGGPRFAEDLRRRGATHAEEARRQIEASGTVPR